MGYDDEELALLGHLNLMEFCRESARWSGGRGAIEEADGVLMFATGTTFPALSQGALRMDHQVSGHGLVERADEWFRERRRGYTVWARDLGGIDDDIMEAAESAGFTTLGSAPEMVCRTRLADKPVGNDVELRWATDESGVADFVAVNADAYSTYGMPREVVGDTIVDPKRVLVPHINTMVAYVENEPVAAAQTLLSHAIAGVYWVGTVESARGRGLGEAVTRAVTNRAFDLGAQATTLQASPMGEPIYARMGYETAFRHRTFVRFSPP
jgi:GNAT superfamily N-acetyltransferase